MAHLRIVHSADLDQHHALAVMAGWKPSHRSLEAGIAELNTITERDNEARAAAVRRATQ